MYTSSEHGTIHPLRLLLISSKYAFNNENTLPNYLNITFYALYRSFYRLCSFSSICEIPQVILLYIRTQVYKYHGRHMRCLLVIQSRWCSSNTFNSKGSSIALQWFPVSGINSKIKTARATIKSVHSGAIVLCNVDNFCLSSCDSIAHFTCDVAGILTTTHNLSTWPCDEQRKTAKVCVRHYMLYLFCIDQQITFSNLQHAADSEVRYFRMHRVKIFIVYDCCGILRENLGLLTVL